jgi:hypothetical protein
MGKPKKLLKKNKQIKNNTQSSIDNIEDFFIISGNVN